MTLLTAWLWASVCTADRPYHLIYHCRSNLHLFVESISSNNAISFLHFVLIKASSWSGIIFTCLMCKLSILFLVLQLRILYPHANNAFLFPELQFVGQTDNIQSCKFVQTMEQRLQRAFQDAERKVLNTSNNLTVQVQCWVLCQCLLPTPPGYSLPCVCFYSNTVPLLATVKGSLCFYLQ